MQSILQILKVNEEREIQGQRGAFKVQDAECILLDESGGIEKVGVLRIPQALKDKVKEGHFTGTFALDANWKTRQIEAVLVAITPLPPDYFKKSNAGKAAGA